MSDQPKSYGEGRTKLQRAKMRLAYWAANPKEIGGTDSPSFVEDVDTVLRGLTAAERRVEVLARGPSDASTLKKGDVVWTRDLRTIRNGVPEELREHVIHQRREGYLYIKGVGKFEPDDMRLETAYGIGETYVFLTREAAEDGIEACRAWRDLKERIRRSYSSTPPLGVGSAAICAAIALLGLNSEEVK